jgi:cephalosporin-C deacetylase-like acetyl esterase
MRVFSAVALCTLLLISSAEFAQTPAPPAVPARAAVAPLNRADPNSPAQAGRNALYKYLDDIATKDEAERRAAIAKITTKEQAVARQYEVRAKLLDLMGGNFEKTPLDAKVLGSTQLDGFRIEKVLYESQPKFFVTALLYLPDNHPAKLPAIVMAPGHAASGKAGDFAMASTFARNGFAVLSYDPIGQGERLQYPDPKNASAPQQGSPYPGASLATRPTGEHGEAGLQPTLIGDAVARYFGWDGIRAVDYLISRPEIDAERIGAFGCSGGGAMTALLGAADRRVHATATACYITSMDALLPSIGPQDAEQSTPGFIAAGFDFADWVELAAPRPYAIVGTVGDMFPWKGLLASATEARRFYALFDPKAEGTPTGKAGSGPQALPPTPTGPTLNPDTSNTIPPDAPLQVIAGIGGHGNLRPLTSQIVSFFLVNLAHSDAQPILPPPPPAGTSPFAAPNVPAGTLQVTPTGQVATSYPGSETVFSLNLKRASGKIPRFDPQTLLQVQTDVRLVTKAEATPSSAPPVNSPEAPEDPDHILHRLRLTMDDGVAIDAEFYRPTTEGKHPAILYLRSHLGDTGRAYDQQTLRALAQSGTAVLAITPRPSPPGGEETKSPILGPFYMTELRAEQVGKTILGMRVDDVIRSVTFFAGGETIDPNNITAVASGHMGLVLLHAAVLDPRLKHITIDHVLQSYDSLLKAPMLLDAPQDILPGVLLKYDIPDLVRVLGRRLTATDWLPGTANLASPEK